MLAAKSLFAASAALSALCPAGQSHIVEHVLECNQGACPKVGPFNRLGIQPHLWRLERIQPEALPLGRAHRQVMAVTGDCDGVEVLERGERRTRAHDAHLCDHGNAPVTQIRQAGSWQTAH